MRAWSGDPFKLQTLVRARYSAQTISVFNAGIAGRKAAEDRSRLMDAISETSPELVLLMEAPTISTQSSAPVRMRPSISSSDRWKTWSKTRFVEASQSCSRHFHPARRRLPSRRGGLPEGTTTT